MKINLIVVGLLGIFFANTIARAVESSYTEIGFLPGYEHSNFPTSITDDGRTVVGWSVNVLSERTPYIWHHNAGIAPLGSLIPGNADHVLISGDGDSIFVGQGTNVSRWTQAGGVAPLFSAPVGSYGLALSGSSTDGRSLTGVFYADGTPGEPATLTSFLWREGIGMTQISDGFLSRGISPDGNYLIGNRSIDPNSALTDVVRRGLDGTETIVNSGYSFADATAASADGSVVIGSSSSFGFRWTPSDSLPIGQLPLQNDATSPLDVSHNGSIVVGYAEGAPQGAFVWDPSHGIRSIHQLLLDQNVDVSNIAFVAAEFVSADGRTVVGSALASGGGEAAWVATVVPEPSTIVLAALAVPILLRHAKRQRRVIN